MNPNCEPLPDYETFLPEDFIPGINHVIIGRGKKSYNHCGNEKFGEKVRSRLGEYSLAKTKAEKSLILKNTIRSVHATGGFIKEDPSRPGRWMTAGAFLAREKTSQAFRDSVSDGYKSSKASKKKRRKEQAMTEGRSAKRVRCIEYDDSPLSLDHQFMDFEPDLESLLRTALEETTVVSSSELDEIDVNDLEGVDASVLEEEDYDTLFESPTNQIMISSIYPNKLFFDLTKIKGNLDYSKDLPTFDLSPTIYPEFQPSRNVPSARTA